MAGDVPITMKAWKKLWNSLLCLSLSAVLLGGCGTHGVSSGAQEQLTSFLEESWESAYASPFGEHLCVIDGTAGEADASVTAEAAAVFSVSDQRVIYQKNPFERMHPASITKIMTALLAIRNGNLEDRVTVGQESVITEPGASLCHISPGDTLTLEQLLYGLMLPSGNDAAAAIAVHLAGSVEAFSDFMNQEALALGATDTHFVNPHGLTDENHYTTAYDLYLIFNEALKEPEFRKIISTVSYTAQYEGADGQTKTQEWTNSNQYLTGQVPMPDGLTAAGGKTGTTKAAGSCLIMDSQDGEQRDYISIVMKAESREKLYDNMTNIIGKIVN